MPSSLDTFLRIRALLQGVTEREGLLTGSLEFDPSKGNVASDLTELQESGVLRESRQNGQLVFISESISGKLDLLFDLGQLAGYFETYDSLIISHPDEPPETFLVRDENQILRTGYLGAYTFLQLLKSKVEVWDRTEQRFFLVDQQAVEVPLVYLAQQTTKLPDTLSEVTRFLDSKHLDADTRWAFFRKASIRLLHDIPTERRLGLLFEKLARVFERAQQDYSLYLERFSFEDLLKNFDEKRLKFVGDLNQVLSSIQTALIAVPIGFFLIAEKFKPASHLLAQNLVLASGGVIFFGLLFVLSLNQGKTLEGIKLALDDFEEEQKNKITERSERLKELLAATHNQYRRVRCLLYVVRFILLLFSIVILAAVLWCSSSTLQELLPYSI